MKKEDADTLKKYVDDVDGSEGDALAYMSEEDLNNDLSCLDILEEWLGDGISDYSLDTTHDLLDEDNKQMIRVFWFSKGMTDTFICLNGRGEFTAWDEDISYRLLGEVCLLIDDLRSKD